MIGKSLALAVVGLAFGLFAMPASAAPTGNLKGVEGNTSAAEPVHYGRRCWRHRGHYHCRRYVRPHYYPSYAYRPYYAPGFRFYFGGGHRHWGHRRWW
jgi:hypothetical protein